MAARTWVRTGETPPGTVAGHGTGALGPSDSSDTGSDIRGGPGLVDDDGIGLAEGTTSDADRSREVDAGADVGDADLDSDTDRGGTGERAAAGRDATSPVDVTLFDEAGRPVDGEDLADDTATGGGGRDERPGDVEAEDADTRDDADLDTTLLDGARRGDVEREAMPERAPGDLIDADALRSRGEGPDDGAREA